jgi:hypothetical protein
VQARLAELGISLGIPDLNEPGFRSLTVTRMLARLDQLSREAHGTHGAAEKSERLVLFGSSLGGYTAATWAAQNPGQVESLVLLAPAFDLAARWKERMPDRDLRRWREDGVFAFEHYAHGRKEELSIDFLDDAAGYDPFPLPRAPTLVLQGRRDDVVDPRLAREFAARMGSRARLVELDDGHQLTADLALLWREISAHLASAIPQLRAARPTP